MPAGRPRILFAGTPDFAAIHLQALLDRGIDVSAVLCQPDRPSGRNRRLRPGPVKALATARGIPVLQPATLRTADHARAIVALPADLLVVVAYGLILPATLLAAFPGGAYNVHASLLPRWRGAAPIQRALEAGDTETGISIQRMVVELDAGDVVLARACPITPADTGGSLHDRLAALGAQALGEWLAGFDPARPPPGTPQDPDRVTYARKLDKREARMDWQAPADLLARRVRAFNPWPVASFGLGDRRIRVWAAHAAAADRGGAPGEVLAAGGDAVVAACGDGALALTELQLPGGRRLPVRDVLNARADWFEPGSKLSP